MVFINKKFPKFFKCEDDEDVTHFTNVLNEMIEKDGLKLEWENDECI